jgi:hypothetical protein
MQSVLYYIVERPEDGVGGTGFHLEKIDLRGLTDGGLDYRIHRDSLIAATGVYVAGTNTTTWTMPFNQASEGGDYEVIQSHADWGDELGRVIPEVDFDTDGQATVLEDYSAYECHIGRKYEHSYTFTEPMIEFSKGLTGDPKPVTQGRLQITAYVTLVGAPADYEYPFSGVFVGGSTIGPPTPKSGEHEFDVGGKSTDVSVRVASSSFLPFTMVGAEWEGFYVGRASGT